MRSVVPTVFAKNKKEFDLVFPKLIKISKEIQIDFMDGKFVKSKSVKLSDISKLRKYKNKFEAHLMVRNPGEWISDLKEKGFYKVLFHYEAVKDLDSLNRLIFLIKENKMKAWIVFNPKTDFNRINEVLDRLHSGLSGVMFMGVNPGRQGQKLDLNISRRVKNLRRIYGKIKIEIDGGVNDKTIKILKDAGVDIVSVGSFVSKSKNPKKALDLLKKDF